MAVENHVRGVVGILIPRGGAGEHPFHLGAYYWKIEKVTAVTAENKSLLMRSPIFIIEKLCI